MIYKTSMDKLTVIITVIVSIIFFIVIMGGLSNIKNPQINLFMLSVSLSLILVYVLTYAFKPQYYQLDENELTIHRMISNVKIKRENIKSVEKLDAEMMKNTIRTFGVGGLFGYYGKFYNKEIGKMTLYTTQRVHRLLIKTMDDKNIVISPDLSEKLIEQYYLKR
ncbi:MAG: PH domain-containing protein [Chitinophagales bacterium]|nr:PH domain-containing protein [Chitinophagales bacterium]